MKRMKKLLILLSALAINSAFAFDAAVYYEKKCSSCHTIGGGDDVAPDLKGIHERRSEEWLIKFVKNSEEVIKSGDPIANELFAKFRNKKMPAQEISDQEVKYILDFIKSGNAGGPVSYRPATEGNPYDYEMGKNLYLGKVKFENGGPACISCHGAGTDVTTLGGGSLGPDLVIKSYPDYLDKGLNKVLSKISFPSMAEVYANKALSENENYYLRVFFMKENAKYTEHASHNGDSSNKFVLLGLALASVLLLLMDFSWRNRRKKSKKPY